MHYKVKDQIYVRELPYAEDLLILSSVLFSVSLRNSSPNLIEISISFIAIYCQKSYLS